MLTQQSPYHQHPHTPTTPRPRSSQQQRSSSANAYRQSLPPGVLLDHVRTWKQNEVAQWLKEVNCGQHADKFADNDLYGEIILDIDQDALKEISITSVGDRIKIYNAVKLLRSQCYGQSQTSSRPVSRVPTTPFGMQQHSSLHHANTIQTVRVRHAPSPLASLNQSFAIPPGPATGPAAYHPPSTATIPSIGRNNEGYFNPSNIAPRPIQTATWREEQREVDMPKTPTGKKSHMRSTSNTAIPGTPGGDGFVYTSEIRENCIRVSGFGRTTVTKIDGCRNSDDIMRLLFKKFPVDYEPGKWGLMTKAESESSTPRFLTDNELLQMCRDPRRAEKFELVLREKGGSPTNVASRPIQTPTKAPGRFMGIGRLLSASPTPEESTYTPSSSQKSNAFGPSGAFIGTSSSATVPISQISGPLGLTPVDDLRKPIISRHYQAGDSGLGPGLTPPAAGRGRRGRKEKLKDYFGQRPPSELISQNLAEYFPGHEPDVLDQAAQRLSLRRSRMFPAGRLSVASTASFGSLSSINPQAAHRSTYASLVGAESNDEGLTSWGESILGSLSKQAPPVPPIPGAYAQDGSRPLSGAESFKSQDTVDEQVRRYTIGKPEGIKMPSPIPPSPIEEETVVEEQEILSPLPKEGPVDQPVVGTIAIEEEQQTANRFASANATPINWIKGKQIGSGSFGIVYLGMDSMSGLLMAVKQVELPTGATQNEERKKSMLDALQREIALLRDLHHEHIVQYLGSQSDETYLNIFLEYVPGGSVQQLLTSYGALLEPLVRSFVRQIVEGLNYLHDGGIIHRDIKGANVLVDNKGGIKISDFGISKKVEDNLLTNHRPSLTGSVFWMAPEVVQQKEYTNKADIWSLGCLVVEMFTGEHPYPTLDQMQAMYQIGIRSSAPTIPEDISPDAQDFLKGCFNVDHHERPAASKLLQHAFLTTPAPPINMASSAANGNTAPTITSSKDDASSGTAPTNADSKDD